MAPPVLLTENPLKVTWDEEGGKSEQYSATEPGEVLAMQLLPVALVTSLFWELPLKPVLTRPVLLQPRGEQVSLVA